MAPPEPRLQKGAICCGITRLPTVSIFFRALATVLLATTSLSAHPNHRATQAMEVSLVPSTQNPGTPSEVSITVEGAKRVMVSNGLPDHLTGRFPNADNPNGIRPQRHRFTLPVSPAVNERSHRWVAGPSASPSTGCS